MENSTASLRSQWVGALLNALVVFAVWGGWLAPIVWFMTSWLLVAARPAGPNWRRLWIWFSAVVLTGLLFLIRRPMSASPVLTSIGLDSLGQTVTNLAAILGFTGLSYCFLRSIYALLDDRRWDFITYARYWFFAPTFVSGPILKPSDYLRPIPGDRRAALAEGAARILSGIFRITAALLLEYANPILRSRVYGFAAVQWPVYYLWLSLFTTSLWLFLDFSGYSEIFIGFARMCGVRAPENFDRPLTATSITAFWQRWHISLGDWLRACIYDPLSRNFIRISPRYMTIVSMIVPAATMLICGAWHGLSKAFLMWGMLHGAGLGAHAVWKRKTASWLPDSVRTHRAYEAVSWLATQTFIAAAWVFFITVDATFTARIDLFLALVGIRR